MSPVPMRRLFRGVAIALIGSGVAGGSIVAVLGIDHEKLSYRHSGRDFRLTDVGGA